MVKRYPAGVKTSINSYSDQYRICFIVIYIVNQDEEKRQILRHTESNIGLKSPTSGWVKSELGTASIVLYTSLRGSDGLVHNVELMTTTYRHLNQWKTENWYMRTELQSLVQNALKYWNNCQLCELCKTYMVWCLLYQRERWNVRKHQYSKTKTYNSQQEKATFFSSNSQNKLAELKMAFGEPIVTKDGSCWALTECTERNWIVPPVYMQ